MNCDTHTVRCWKIAEWPALDQELWARGCLPPPLFEEGGHGARLAPVSREKRAKGYGRWLAFLASQGWLDAALSPDARITPARLAAYFRHLRTIGNADFTIIGRFAELSGAMRIMVPGYDARWICRPRGVSIRTALPCCRRTLFIPDGAALADWAWETMARADRRTRPKERLSAFRNGLLLAVLAHCARRLRSIALLRVGREIVRTGGVYHIELAPDQVKTGRPDCFDLPATLTPAIDRYLAEIRPALLGGSTHDAFWVSASGTPWAAGSIQVAVQRLSRKRFGTGFGPHRFRHAIASTAPYLDQANPGLAAAVLAISEGVTREHYNRCNQIAATRSYHEALAARRAALADRRTCGR